MRSLRGIYPMTSDKVKLCTTSGASLTVTYRKHQMMSDCNNSGNGSNGIQLASEHTLDSAIASELLINELKDYSKPTPDVQISINSSIVLNGRNASNNQQDNHLWLLTNDGSCSSDCGSNKVFPESFFREACVQAGHALANNLVVVHDDCNHIDIRSLYQLPEECKIFDTASVAYLDGSFYTNIGQSSCQVLSETFLYGEDVPAISFLQSNGTYDQDSWATYNPDLEDEIKMLNLKLPPPLQFSDDGSTLYDHDQALMGRCGRDIDDIEFFHGDVFLSLDSPNQHCHVDVESSFSQSSWNEFFEDSSMQGQRTLTTSTEDTVETSAILTYPSEERSRTFEAGCPSDVISVLITRKCKNLRKKRKRRTSPLSTIQCLGLLSSSGNMCSSVQEQSHQVSTSDNANNKDQMNVFSRRIKVRYNKNSDKDCVNAFTWEQDKEQGSSPQVEQYDRACPISRYTTSICRTNYTENGGSAVAEGASRRTTKSHNRRPYVHHHSLYRRVRQICDSPVRRRKRSGKGKRTAICGSYKPVRAPSALLPAEAVTTLREWFYEHIDFPFANKEEKQELVSSTGLALSQVENWLSNYRHKLKIKRIDYQGRVINPPWINRAPSQQL